MMTATKGRLRIAPDFRWPDTVTVRTARKLHQCEMVLNNPVERCTREDGTAYFRQRHPDRPVEYRRWDGGEKPEGHTDLIGQGEQYVEYFGEAPAYQAGQRYCRACAIAAGIATDAEPAR